MNREGALYDFRPASLEFRVHRVSHFSRSVHRVLLPPRRNATHHWIYIPIFSHLIARIFFRRLILRHEASAAWMATRWANICLITDNLVIRYPASTTRQNRLPKFKIRMRIDVCEVDPWHFIRFAFALRNYPDHVRTHACNARLRNFVCENLACLFFDYMTILFIWR